MDEIKESLSRSAKVLGSESICILSKKRVAVFGIGGVGGYTVEALARTGIGSIDLIDSDTVEESNINRQLVATYDTVGKYKVDVCNEHIKKINPDCKVRIYKTFFLPDNKEMFSFKDYDYVIDAIDTVAGKLALIECCYENNVPIISAMGAGNKINGTGFKVADIYDTKVCPLAKVMRRELKKRNINSLKCVYSEEEPVSLSYDKRTPGSVAHVPGVLGLIMAGEVIKDLLKI